MKTVRITRPGGVELIEKPMPRIDRNYVLVETRVAPMCNEYLAYRDGVYLERNRPDSLGHELAGVVVDAPAEASVHIGQRVVALCGFPCGRCQLCKRGYYSHCAATEDPREVCGSDSGECGFAQYAVKPDWMLEPVPPQLSLEHASMACCGLGPTFGAMKRAGLGAGATVLITGLGAVGLGGVVNSKFRGATVIGVVRTPYRTKLAQDLGCDHVVDPTEGDPLSRITELTDGRGVDLAIECSGQPSYQRLAVDSVSRLGAVVFIAEPGEITVSVDNDLVQRGISLIGSLDINRADAAELFQVIEAVPDQLDRFITHSYPLDRIGDAFEKQSLYESGKIILHPWAD